MRNGYGLCLIRDNELVSWCLLNKRAGDNCEIVIETDEKYRSAGFATLMGAAILEYCFSKNLIPSWHCASDNFASIAVAEKIGFTITLVYPVYYWYPSWFTHLVWLIKNKPSTLIYTLTQILRSFFAFIS
jgi:RimJ/RimL family protein N-acetyltransferase